ncbi:hypothetical protein M9434_002769 [Picochlorum sp. BPE23]|nr:hypothetical protein M9434_002769 [Picochlorum sp. BPE23]
MSYSGMSSRDVRVSVIDSLTEMVSFVRMEDTGNDPVAKEIQRKLRKSLDKAIATAQELEACLQNRNESSDPDDERNEYSDEADNFNVRSPPRIEILTFCGHHCINKDDWAKTAEWKTGEKKYRINPSWRCRTKNKKCSAIVGTTSEPCSNSGKFKVRVREEYLPN